MSASSSSVQEKLSTWPNVASASLGARVLFATDNFFAPAPHLLKDSEPVFIDGKFTEFGKWMDGWESRRKRILGHDWCIVELPAPCIIFGFDVDTCHFTGNYAPACSIQGVNANGNPKLAAALKTYKPQPQDMGTAASSKEMDAVESLNSKDWPFLLKKRLLQAGFSDTRHNFVNNAAADQSHSYTHLRLNMFPDGGIARLKVYGRVIKHWGSVNDDDELDLAAMLNGGRIIGFSGECFGTRASNLLLPGKSTGMAYGWETKRHPDRPAVIEMGSKGELVLPGDDWVAVELGHVGRVQRVIVETHHFKGNAPESFVLMGRDKDEDVWKVIVDRSKLTPHSRHVFEIKSSVVRNIDVSVVKMKIFPDGGVSRLRVLGRVSDSDSQRKEP